MLGTRGEQAPTEDVLPVVPVRRLRPRLELQRLLGDPRPAPVPLPPQDGLRVDPGGSAGRLRPAEDRRADQEEEEEEEQKVYYSSITAWGFPIFFSLSI